MEKELFIQDVRNKSPQDIYEEHFISGEVWIFRKKFSDDWFVKYDGFKKYISNKLDVHYHDIGIAGSAKMGFSLNPKKDYKSFDDDSDIDIIIVSRELFKRFWDEYLHDSYNPSVKIKNIKYVSLCIFRRYLTLDYFRNNDYYKNWQKRTNDLEKDFQLMFHMENEVHYRIFESWDAVKQYYVSNIAMLKEGISLDENN